MKNIKYSIFYAVTLCYLVACKPEISTESNGTTEKSITTTSDDIISDSIPKPLTEEQALLINQEFNRLKELSHIEKLVLGNKLIAEFNNSVIGRYQFAPRAGKEILAADADKMTEEYYNDFANVIKDYVPKSIYLDSAQILKLIRTQRPICGNTKTFGVRFYFAQYPANYSDPRVAGMNTIILRAVCDGEDVAHDLNEGVNGNYVAYNYGDICPPYCHKDLNKNCTGGYYKSTGDCMKTCN